MSTGLTEVLEKSLEHVVIQVFKFLSAIEAIDNDGICGLLCELQFHQ